MNKTNKHDSTISESGEDAKTALAQALQRRHPGFAKDLLAGIDTDALLATPIDELFAEYTPEDSPSTNPPAAAPQP